MILVYFLNGETATMPTATHARAEPFAGDGMDGVAYPGITCLDAEDHEVGRFRVTEITGYVIAGGQDEDEDADEDEDDLMDDELDLVDTADD